MAGEKKSSVRPSITTTTTTIDDDLARGGRATSEFINRNNNGNEIHLRLCLYGRDDDDGGWRHPLDALVNVGLCAIIFVLVFATTHHHIHLHNHNYSSLYS